MASKDAISEQHINSVLLVKSNYVALMPYGFIEDISTPRIVYNSDKQWFGETEKGLLQYAQGFQIKKINIMVKPHIWIKGGAYTGGVKMQTEKSWRLLENTYRSFILSYAKAAAVLDAEIFCIGTELEQFVINRPRYWRELILEIRAVYQGKLTYAANWDEFACVSFWKDLDFIGIDAYFPLSSKKLPTIAEFEMGWATHKKRIINSQQQFDIPVIFTEFGYRSVDFTGKNPWDARNIKGTVNLKAQVNALQAIYNQFWREKWFAGGFIWKWFHNHNSVGGEKNNRFTPQNKPAEQLIKKLYGL